MRSKRKMSDFEYTGPGLYVTVSGDVVLVAKDGDGDLVGIQPADPLTEVMFWHIDGRYIGQPSIGIHWRQLARRYDEPKVSTKKGAQKHA